jgi:hypothetical protein
MSMLASAVLVGIGGTRWITSEMQKTIFRTVAANAALAPKDERLALAIQRATPQQALEIAKKLSGS